MEPSTSYTDWLYPQLQDDEFSLEYLNIVSMESGPQALLVALNQVAQARGIGMSELSEQTQLNRANLYTVLSEKGNPEWASFNKLLSALGFTIGIQKASSLKQAS